MYYLVEDPNDKGLSIWHMDNELPGVVTLVQLIDKGVNPKGERSNCGCSLGIPVERTDDWCTWRATIAKNIVAQSPDMEDMIASATMRRLNP
jgi:hypothetical protein